MTSGEKHAIGSNIAIVAGVIGASVAVGAGAVSLPVATILVSGLILGKYANPDVRDQEGVRNYAEHLIDKKIGRFPGMVWSLIWHPLAWLIPHRKWASHFAGPATMIAWLYYFVPPLIVCAILWPTAFDVAIVVALLHFPGWAIQDTVHLAQDGWRFNW